MNVPVLSNQKIDVNMVGAASDCLWLWKAVNGKEKSIHILVKRLLPEGPFSVACYLRHYYF